MAGLGDEVKFFLLAGIRGERGRVLFSRLRAAGIEVIGAEGLNVRSPMNLVRLAGLIRRWRPDIVQANLYSAEVLAAAARVLARGSGARYLRRLTISDIRGYRHAGAVRLLDRFFHRTIACSPVVAEAYEDFMGAGRRSEIVTIPNGGLLKQSVTTEKEKERARKSLDLPGEAFVVAHIGRMYRGAGGPGLEAMQKAQDVLIKAFGEAFGDASGCWLVLVGDGPLRGELESLARRLGVDCRTLFLGQQPEPWPALKAADVFCFPSRYEGLPNVLPEAASCGLPVIASDIPEISDLSPGEAWILTPVDDVGDLAGALLRVRDDQDQFHRKAREAARELRKVFSMDACARKYRAAYESVLSPARRKKG